MTNNSDGLTPTLRPQLGVGFNRALPAPFGFDNGIKPDGSNDRLEIPSLCRGLALPTEITVEFWADTTIYDTDYCLSIADHVNHKFINVDGYNNSLQMSINTSGGFIYSGPNSIPNIPRCHIALNYNFSTGSAEIFINGNKSGPAASPPLFSLTPTDFLLFCRSNAPADFRNFTSNKTDEFRIYSKILTQAEIRLNYNSGIGNNPCLTENLFVWYKFQEFEILDFSVFQDNSDLRLGIRDFSGHYNHAQPFNMDTNPTSPTYVLKPF